MDKRKRPEVWKKSARTRIIKTSCELPAGAGKFPPVTRRNLRQSVPAEIFACIRRYIYLRISLPAAFAGNFARASFTVLTGYVFQGKLLGVLVLAYLYPDGHAVIHLVSSFMQALPIRMVFLFLSHVCPSRNCYWFLHPEFNWLWGLVRCSWLTWLLPFRKWSAFVSISETWSHSENNRGHSWIYQRHSHDADASSRLVTHFVLLKQEKLFSILGSVDTFGTESVLCW